MPSRPSSPSAASRKRHLRPPPPRPSRRRCTPHLLRLLRLLRLPSLSRHNAMLESTSSMMGLALPSGATRISCPMPPTAVPHAARIAKEWSRAAELIRLASSGYTAALREAAQAVRRRERAGARRAFIRRLHRPPANSRRHPRALGPAVAGRAARSTLQLRRRRWLQRCEGKRRL